MPGTIAWYKRKLGWDSLGYECRDREVAIIKKLRKETSHA